MQNPVRGLLHGSAALASVAGLWWLLARSGGGAGRNASLAVFGASLVILFTVSTLYHTVPWRDPWKERMLRMDNAAILVLIAGTYTPMAVVLFDGLIMAAILAVVWGITGLGLAQLAFFPRETTGFAVGLAGVLGWLAVLLVVPLAQRLPWTAIAIAFAGGMAYTVGMVLVLTHRPRLWPRVFSYHEVFHILVIAGSVAHYLLHWHWVAPYPSA